MKPLPMTGLVVLVCVYFCEDREVGAGRVRVGSGYRDQGRSVSYLLAASGRTTFYRLVSRGETRLGAGKGRQKRQEEV